MKKTFSEMLVDEYKSRKVKEGEDLKITKFAEISECVERTVSPDKIYVIEKYCDGKSVVLEKRGNLVSILDEKGEDVSVYYDKIRTDFSNCSQGDLSVKGTIVKDCLYMSDVVVKGFVWKDRIAMLRKLKYTSNLKENPNLIVKMREDAIKAIEIMSNLKDSKGAIAKSYDGLSNSPLMVYEKGK